MRLRTHSMQLMMITVFDLSALSHCFSVCTCVMVFLVLTIKLNQLLLHQYLVSILKHVKSCFLACKYNALFWGSGGITKELKIYEAFALCWAVFTWSQSCYECHENSYHLCPLHWRCSRHGKTWVSQFQVMDLGFKSLSNVQVLSILHKKNKVSGLTQPTVAGCRGVCKI